MKQKFMVGITLLTLIIVGGVNTIIPNSGIIPEPDNPVTANGNT